MRTETKENWAFAAFAAVVTAFVVAVAVATARDAVAAVVTALAAFVVAVAVKEDYKSSLIFSGVSILLSLISFAISFSLSINFSFLWTWQCLLLLLVLTEIFFLLDKKQPSKKDNKEIFAWKRKGVGLFYSVCSILGLTVLYNGYLLVKDYFYEILTWIGYIGIGILILIAVYGIVRAFGWLNSLRYQGGRR